MLFKLLKKRHHDMQSIGKMCVVTESIIISILHHHIAIPFGSLRPVVLSFPSTGFFFFWGGGGVCVTLHCCKLKLALDVFSPDLNKLNEMKDHREGGTDK